MVAMFTSFCFLEVSLLVGIVFVIASYIMKINPPKDINHLYGYRTSKSMKNQANWDKAQQLSTKNMMLLGWFLIVISLLFGFFQFQIYTRLFIGFGLMIGGIIWMFIKVEKELIN